jgi:formate dehydrogenase iron-sulfur subunit
VPTRDLPSMWAHVGAAAVSLVAGVAAAFAIGRSR